MSEPTKLLFDECLGKPLMEDLLRLLSWDEPTPIFDHLLDYFNSGVCDSVWIPKVASEKWIIITGDRSKKNKKIKLPKICKEYNITHILLGSSVIHLKQSQKANTIVAVWEEIKKCKEAEIGSRFMLTVVKGSKPTLKKIL